MRSTASIIVSLLILVPVSLVDASSFSNPLLFGYIKDILRGFVYAVIYVGTPAVVLLLVWTGFAFVAAQGDAKMLSIAKKNSVIAVGAAVLLFGLWAIIQMVGNTLAGLSTAGLLLVLAGFLGYAWLKE